MAEYIKQTFLNKTADQEGTTLMAEHLIHIEDGIYNAQQTADEKQSALISGENIKTINGISILGSGNIAIVGTEGGGESSGSSLTNTDGIITADAAVSAIEENFLFNVNANKTFEANSVGITIKDEISCLDDGNNAFRLCDGEGNVVLKIDENSTDIGGNVNINGNISYDNKGTECWLSGKSIWVIGDSLSNSNQSTSWIGTLAKATNSTWYPNLNQGGTSKGGTKTLHSYADGEPCGQMRAKKLVEHYKNGYPVDVVFIQNVNDSNESIGTKADLPWFANQVYTYNGTTLDNSSSALTYFNENISTVLESVTPTVGTVVLLKYANSNSVAKSLKITSTAKANGTMTLKVGSKEYGVTVTTSMSIEDIIHSILEYSFTDYSDLLNDAGDEVVFTLVHGSGDASVTVDVGSTGITYTLTDVNSVGTVPIAFMSKNVNDWLDTNSWQLESKIGLWSAYKGLIEYLLTNIPNVQIYMTLLSHISINYDTTPYRRADGTFDMEAWHEKLTSHINFFNCQKEVAEYYYLPYIDVEGLCGISPVNAYTDGFYPVQDVHPTTKGQQKWGQTIAKLIATR